MHEIAPYGKSSISNFKEFFASIEKILILGGRRSTSLLFSEVVKSSWYFLSQVLSCSATHEASRIYNVYY